MGMYSKSLLEKKGISGIIYIKANKGVLIWTLHNYI